MKPLTEKEPFICETVDERAVYGGREAVYGGKGSVYREESSTRVVVSRAAATANDFAAEGKELFMRILLWGAVLSQI